MDPDTAYSILTGPPHMASYEDRIANGNALADWLLTGGYAPSDLIEEVREYSPGYVGRVSLRLYVAGYVAALRAEWLINDADKPVSYSDVIGGLIEMGGTK